MPLCIRVDPVISDLDKMNAIGYFKRFSYLLEPEVDDLLDGVSFGWH